MFLAADARRPEVLERAGLAGATAVVCAESDDLRTLAIALLARELRPDARVVVQLRNAAVGRALSDSGVIVLDAAALAAPSLVEACLRAAVHRVSLDGDDFLVVEVEATREATLRALYGDLAPLALVRAADDASPRLVVSPGRDEIVRAADRVVLVGASAEVMAAGLVRQPARRQPDYIGARAPRAPTKRPTNIVLFALRSLDRRIRLAVSALLGLTAGLDHRPHAGIPRGRRHQDVGARRALLHRRDDRHGRVRRLLLPRPARPGCGSGPSC